MPSNVHSKVLQACFNLMRHVARCLLRAGIGYKEFSDASKAAFVDVATSDYGIRGRKTNISRVAVMTGLTRKEVRKIRDKLERTSAISPSKPSPGADVLHFWFTDKDFLDESGRPRSLSFNGAGMTFGELVRRYGGDIPPGAMRTELKRIGAVEIDQTGSMHVKKRDFLPSDFNENLINSLNLHLTSLAATVAHNADPQRDQPRLQRISISERVAPGSASSVKAQLTSNAAQFISTVDELFSEHEMGHDADSSAAAPKMGVGVFWYEEDT